MIAALPMYDWPELAPATDRLWRAIARALAARGIPAPAGLDRTRAPEALWTDPGLLIAQACGLPLVRLLAGRVTLLGALDHGVPGCAPGSYRSAIVVRAGDRRDRLAAFRGARLAVNDRGSQSGWAAPLHHAAPLARGGRFFGAVVPTGSHAASAAAVAEAGADLAALDAVSWRLVRRFRPGVAARLRVLMLTDPTPALPLVAGPGRDPAPLRDAVAAAVARLDAPARSALGLTGFVPLGPGAYAVIARRADRAEAALAEAARP